MSPVRHRIFFQIALGDQQARPALVSDKSSAHAGTPH